MNSAEQNPATNQMLETPPNAAANNADAADPSISAFPRKHSHKRWIFLAAFVVLVVAGAFLWHYLSGFESTDDAQVDAHLYPVSARISGYVQKVHVEDNQWVDEGSPLVEIDPKDYEVALARAQATLETSEASAKMFDYRRAHIFRRYVKPIEIRSLGYQKRGSFDPGG